MTKVMGLLIIPLLNNKLNKMIVGKLQKKML